jgi:kinesin family protein 2/24
MQVRKRPLNKKEVSKKEEDIIDIELNSLTVHETKLKVHAKLLIFIYLPYF